MRKAALSYGFYEVFHCLSEILAKELTSSGSSYTPEIRNQLNIVIHYLRNDNTMLREEIQPIMQPTAVQPSAAPLMHTAVPVHQQRHQMIQQNQRRHK